MIKEIYRSDGLLHTLIKRNDFLALYSVGGTHSDITNYYEVCKIYIRKDKYGTRESLPTNEQFGRDRSRCFINYDVALEYFNNLSNILEIEFKNAKKPEAILQESCESIPEHQSEAA
jgi:hypothetical protein